MVTENLDQAPATDSPATTEDTQPVAETTQDNLTEVPNAETDTTPTEEQPSGNQPLTSGVPPPAPTAPPDQAPAQAPPAYTPQQITKMQQDAAQYAQVQQQAALQNQADSYKQQLEASGYLPEQAEQAANVYMQSQKQHQDLMQQAEQYGQHLQGQMMTAVHLAKKFNLDMDDLSTLRTYNDPQSMEGAAKKLAEDRKRDTELAAFKQARVPSQALDNSQGSPEVAADEGGWLDRYNAGDRSSSAQAAARKAAGLS